MIVKRNQLISMYENTLKEMKDKIIRHMMDKAGIKIQVYDHNMKKVMITNSFDEAFERAFNDPYSIQSGHFATNTRLLFYKATPSLLTRTDKDLFIDLLDYINQSPNVIYKELNAKFLL